jgi:hypothetical protein
VSLKKGKVQHQIQQMSNELCESSALNLVKNNGLLSSQDLNYLGKSFGKPSTNVRLPSGDLYSTKNLASRNQNSKNNHLSDTSSTSCGSITPIP